MIALMMTATFAPLAYIVPMLTTVTGIPLGVVPWLLFAAGVGGIFGNLIGGRLGDWRPAAALIVIFTLQALLYLAGLVAVYQAVGMSVVYVLWVADRLCLPRARAGAHPQGGARRAEFGVDADFDGFQHRHRGRAVARRARPDLRLGLRPAALDQRDFHRSGARALRCCWRPWTAGPPPGDAAAA